MYMIPLETKDGENSSQIEQEQINQNLVSWCKLPCKPTA